MTNIRYGHTVKPCFLQTNPGQFEIISLNVRHCNALVDLISHQPLLVSVIFQILWNPEDQIAAKDPAHKNFGQGSDHPSVQYLLTPQLIISDPHTCHLRNRLLVLAYVCMQQERNFGLVLCPVWWDQTFHSNGIKRFKTNSKGRHPIYRSRRN